MTAGEFLSDHAWKLLLLLALLALSGFFSACETAFFTLSRSAQYRLRHGRGPARVAGRLLERPRGLLNTFLLANILVATAYASVSAVTVLDLQQAALGRWPAAALWLGLLLALILGGEILPKSAALALGERLVVAAAPPVAIVEKVLAPPLWLLQHAFLIPVTRLLAPRQGPERDVTPEELAALLDLSAAGGILAHDANTLLKEIIALTDIRVRDIMTPRVDMTAFDISRGADGLRELFRRTRLRYMPVFEGDLDNIMGMVPARTLFLESGLALGRHVRPVPFVPLAANLERALLQLRVTRSPLAVVVDEYGGTAGLVTMEQILEEIVGDIPDESRREAPAAVQRITDSEYFIDANVPIHEWSEAFKMKLADRRISTLGGFVTSLLDHIPQVGEQVRYRNMVFTVELMRGRRIGRLRLRLLEGLP